MSNIVAPSILSADFGNLANAAAGKLGFGSPIRGFFCAGDAGSPNDTIRLPLPSDGDYDFFVDWGDGNRDNITAYDQSEVTHQY